MARKEKYKIQAGDKLYEASKTYNKAIGWEVLEIWLEGYLSGYKTVIKCLDRGLTKNFYASDMHRFYDTKEEALRALKGGAGNG